MSDVDEREEERSFALGFVQATDRAINAIRTRASAAFLEGDDDRAKVLRSIAKDLDDEGVKHLRQKLEFYAAASLEQARERAKKRGSR